MDDAERALLVSEQKREQFEAQRVRHAVNGDGSVASNTHELFGANRDAVTRKDGKRQRSAPMSGVPE